LASIRILLAISTLGAGGAERVITILSGELARRGHAVTLLTFDHADNSFFEVSPAVRRIALGLAEHSQSATMRIVGNVKRVLAFRRAVRAANPDVVVSFITETNVTALLACLGLGKPVVISERIDPREHPVGRIWSALRRTIYGRASLLVVQTVSVADWCREQWGLRSVATIPNPVLVPTGTKSDESVRTRPFLLSVGRLDRQKGFDVLLQAYALVAADVPDIDLRIAGDGPEADSLRRQAVDAGLTGRVTFLGRVRNIPDLMHQALAFVLPSRYEGFPNVLLEALASGAATVATDCRSGPRQILGHGKYGVLVPVEDHVALAAGLRRICTDADLRDSLRAQAAIAVRPYALETVVSSWELALAGAVGP
jgi:GalNAc-alpha-(1->4)-GalNAc-alpha-(1->3)-diNAcBac-PP-undecaprenol alpha-1,4-N-acetyl-D-galactosaminyltransferase